MPCLVFAVRKNICYRSQSSCRTSDISEAEDRSKQLISKKIENFQALVVKNQEWVSVQIVQMPTGIFREHAMIKTAQYGDRESAATANIGSKAVDIVCAFTGCRSFF